MPGHKLLILRAGIFCVSVSVSQQMASPAPSSRAAALLIGLNYPGTPNALTGCIQDVVNVSAYLQTATPGVAITMVTDGAAPVTRAAILAALTVAAAASATVDFFWLHYSGHGYWQRDGSADERDGRDEVIVAADGVVTDDQILAVLSTFAATCTVFAVFDSCHSGTVADLKYSWPQLQGSSAVMEHPTSRVPARIICLSGCADTGTSAEINGAGAMTTALLQVLGTPTPGALLRVTAFDVASNVLRVLQERRLSQRPLLTSSFNLTRATSLAEPPPSPPPPVIPPPVIPPPRPPAPAPVVTPPRPPRPPRPTRPRPSWGRPAGYW